MLENNVLDRIVNSYYQFSVSNRKIADFVISHPAEAPYMSIRELADSCGVGEATVSRFCRTIKYRNYSDFKLAFANSFTRSERGSSPLYGEITENSSIIEISEKLYTSDTGVIKETLDMIDPDAMRTAADLLENASKVLCMGQGGTMMVAMVAAHLFSSVFGKYYSVYDSHMQMVAIEKLDPVDVVLFFSYSGSTIEMKHALTHARAKSVKTILVTRYPESIGAKLADVVLKCGSTETPIQACSIPPFIAQLYLIDVLFSEVCRRDLDSCKLSRNRIAVALAEKYINI